MENESESDAMSVFGPISPREGQKSDFFSPSSTLRFLYQARQPLSRSESSPDRDWQKNAMLSIFQDGAISVGESSGLPCLPLASLFLTSLDMVSLSHHEIKWMHCLKVTGPSFIFCIPFCTVHNLQENTLPCGCLHLGPNLPMTLNRHLK